MLRTKLLLLPVLYCYTIAAQDAAAPKTGEIATVNVAVTDRKGKPSKGEQILFKAETRGKYYSGMTAANGKFSLKLPAGDKYIISIKSLVDSTKYGVLDIPALGPEEFYTDPFNVDIKFEPARTYTLNNVHFDFGKASLRPESYKELQELLDFLKNKEDVKIEIGGHTDNIGKDADNLKLSQQRADAIRSYLVKKGITAGRVIAKGYGASHPIADNETEEGTQLNRRTEIKLL